MEITCKSCFSKFKIADEKIPTDRSASVSCPKCKSKITIEPKQDEAAAAPTKSDEMTDMGFEEESYEAPQESEEKTFQFIEEEGKIALVCESDPVIRKKIVDVLELMEYHATEAKDDRDALKKLRYQDYDVVVVDEYFGTKDPEINGVLIFLERLHMDVRRNMFVALISDRYRTLDYMMAYNKSVNLIINKKNTADIDKLMSKGLSDHDIFYRIFKETLQ